MAVNDATLGLLKPRKRNQYLASQQRAATGVLSEEDALRMAKRERPGAFGIDPSMFPESAPDPEEAVRRNRRKFLAQQRRRMGRLSTIYTGGDDIGLG